LSLVDNPGNELCNVLEIQKSADPTGIATGVDIDNVFWCDSDEMAFIAKSDTYSCGFCKNDLTSVGWFESVDDPTIEVRKILESTNKISKIQNNLMEGGQEMSEQENVNTETVETADNTVETEVEAVEETVTEEVEKINEPSLAGINEALSKIQETLEQATAGENQREEALSKVREAVEGVEAKVEKRLSDLLERHEKLATEFTSFKEGLDTVEKRLETIEGATALRKSNDVEDEGVTLSKGNTKKSVWVGSFLPPSFDQE
jgi:molecular chaperone DnaK (HSP70)